MTRTRALNARERLRVKEKQSSSSDLASAAVCKKEVNMEQDEKPNQVQPTTEQPPYIMYTPGPIQGSFLALPVTNPSSIPLMPTPSQFFSPLGTAFPHQSIPLANMTPGSFLYPQFLPLQGHAFAANAKTNLVVSPPSDTDDVHKSTVASTQSLVAGKGQPLAYTLAQSGHSQVTALPTAVTSNSETSIPSGSTSVISRVMARKNKLQSQSKPVTLQKLLTTATDAKQNTLHAQLQDEPHFVTFYRFFKASEKSSLLRLRLLTTEGNYVLKWIEVTRQSSHIDPTFGPVDVARILISSHGLCKLQLLFPYFKTIYTKFMPINQDEANVLLSDLSPQHVLCPGLPDYEDKFGVLGYHPSHVRVLETQFLKRYDHEKCPLWHLPSNLFSKSGHLLHNMCKHCRTLQGNLVRQATKACEIDPAERESWTDPSSHRPLAFMSPADKEERYRKLRQERSQLISKLKTYEEQLGISSDRRSSSSEVTLPEEQDTSSSTDQLLKQKLTKGISRQNNEIELSEPLEVNISKGKNATSKSKRPSKRTRTPSPSLEIPSELSVPKQKTRRNSNK